MKRKFHHKNVRGERYHLVNTATLQILFRFSLWLHNLHLPYCDTRRHRHRSAASEIGSILIVEFLVLA